MLRDLTAARAFRVMFGGAAGLGVAYVLGHFLIEQILPPILDPVGDHLDEYNAWRKQRARAARDAESMSRGHRT